MRRAQLSIQTIVIVIVSLVVLTLLLVFLTGRFGATTGTLTQLGPGEMESAQTSCSIACNSANAVVSSPENCNDWEAKFCTKKVRLAGDLYDCSAEFDGEVIYSCENVFGCSC